MLSASLLACSLSLSSIAGGSTGSSLTSIFYGETSVNAFECGLICLYHTMALAAADEILHSQGFLYSSIWNIIASAFHNSKFRKIHCIVLRAYGYRMSVHHQD
jgi:hypothetical protein